MTLRNIFIKAGFLRDDSEHESLKVPEKSIDQSVTQIKINKTTSDNDADEILKLRLKLERCEKVF